MSSTPPRRPSRGRPADELALLRGVLDDAPARICLVSPRLRYLYVNREFAAFAGRPPAAILGLATHEVAGPDFAVRFDAAMQAALAGATREDADWVTDPRHGRRYLALTFCPSRSGCLLYIRDLTETRQREAAVAEQRAQLQAILGGIADGVNVVAPDGRVVLANPGFLRMFDFPARLGAPGTPLADFVRERLSRRDLHPDEDPAAADEALVRARVATILEAPSGTFEETRPDGRIIEGRRDRLPDGTLVNTYSDITARREAERVRTVSREALRRTERLSATASLLAGVAHEINNPLAVVAAQAALLADEAEGTPLAERAEKVRVAAQRCGRIVTSLLASARRQPPKRQPVDLHAAIEAGLDLSADAAAGPVVARETARDVPMLSGDADQLAHLVANLVGNARAALAAMRPPPAIPRIVVRLARERDHAVLRVVDNGPGIPDGLRNRVFDPFFTTRAEGGGTGVGLALCRTIVQAHGGDIRAEATPGGGATLVVRLPLRPVS